VLRFDYKRPLTGQGVCGVFMAGVVRETSMVDPNFCEFE
jgi:hypothetical protein